MTAERKINRGPSAAVENREALIRAAREVFAEEGYQAPLSAIARRAEVGQGSLYRHFPDRVSIALAVFADNVVELEQLAAHSDSTLDDLLHAIGDQAAESSAFIEMLHGVRDDPRVLELGDRMTVLLTDKLAEGLESGALATWATPDDLLIAVAMMGTVVGSDSPERRADTADRARRILLAAFRA